VIQSRIIAMSLGDSGAIPAACACPSGAGQLTMMKLLSGLNGSTRNTAGGGDGVVGRHADEIAVRRRW
jgi:hypothetical protein